MSAEAPEQTPEQVTELEKLTAKWGLSTSMKRAREALAGRA